MIGPIDSRTGGPLELAGLAERTGQYFAPRGWLAAHCSALERPYEHRPQQQKMAEAVAQAFADHAHLAVEAGTGVGKSFAYLIPAILAARQLQRKIVLSTYTIALQEQLIEKDIPFLRESLGIDFKAVLVKGQSNYLCPQRLRFALRSGKDLFDTGQFAELERLEEWAGITTEGSLQDLKHQPLRDVWMQVCAEEGICNGRKKHKDCFFGKARQKMQDADLLVVNHHLFFSDLAIRAGGGGFLPEYVYTVLDEAHQVELVASAHMGIRLSQARFDHWLRRLYVPETRRGIFALLEHGEYAHSSAQLKRKVERMFFQINEAGNFSEERPQRMLHEPLKIDSEVPQHLQRLSRGMRDLMDEVEDEDRRTELQALTRRGEALQQELASFLHQTLDDQVYWLQREGRRRRQVVMYAAPIDVAPLLAGELFGKAKSVVATSATLSVGENLSYFQQRIGANSARSLITGSPFHYDLQMKLLIPRAMPEPTEGQIWLDALVRAIRFLIEQSEGQAFVLFTNSKHLRLVVNALRSFCAGKNYPLLAQGEGLPRHQMLEQFKRRNHAVLFGLDSFWMGVDVPGDNLRNVIITRLPFAVPDQPLIQARCDRIRERGGDPFREYAIPEAILKLRQGVGRLIRSASDEGTVAILDRRLISKGYGRHFMDALPDCPVVEFDIPDPTESM